MKKYLTGNHHAYSLTTIRQYISWYREMSDALVEKLPDRACVINYEDMIANPLSALGTLAELCGLAIPEGALPSVGDDRNCAAPYHDLMKRELHP
jgi:hypothetical protein